MTAAVTLESSVSSISLSLIFGQDGRKVSGWESASRYSVTIVFLRTLALEWLNRGNKSGSMDIANDGVIMWGIVMRGKEIVGMETEEIS